MLINKKTIPLIITLTLFLTTTPIIKPEKTSTICSPSKTCLSTEKCCPTSNTFTCCPSLTTCCSTECCPPSHPICDPQQKSCWKNDCKTHIDISPLEKGLKICEYYKNKDWLPPDYAAAAFCACSGDGSHRWLSPSATCMRNFLVKGHEAFSEDFRDESRRVVEQYYPNRRWGDRKIYFRWLRERWLERVYRVHVEAYRECGCPNLPAVEFYWGLVLKYGKLLVLGGCKVVVMAIEFQGACGCQDW